MQDYGKELVTEPSEDHNRDIINTIYIRNMQRNSGLYKYFHTASINPTDIWPGFITEDDKFVYLGLENYDRISEE